MSHEIRTPMNGVVGLTGLLLETAPSPLPDSAVEGSPDARRGRILVVEDNAINQLVAQGVLTNLGYDVELAADGRQALQALATSSFDAVLMDCHMPEMDGFEATRELRRREGRAGRTPVIAMTAGVLVHDRALCLAAGMDDFVPKPIDVEHLDKVLDVWVTRRRGGVPAVALPAVTRARLDVLRSIGPPDGWGMLPAVIEAFLAGADDRLVVLGSSAALGEPGPVSHAVHSLRGAAANLGAERLAELCRQAEELAGADSAVPAELLRQVTDEHARACTELASIMAERA